MKTTKKQFEYLEWFSAEEMHNATKDWLSELLFIKDEHLFFEDLITSFTNQLLEFSTFSDNKEIIDAVYKSQKQNEALIEKVKTHENELQIMVDGEDQIPEEKIYTKKHKLLTLKIAAFFKEFRLLKSQLFEIFKSVKKIEKQHHLIKKN